jgi:hypothetical protein
MVAAYRALSAPLGCDVLEILASESMDFIKLTVNEVNG